RVVAASRAAASLGFGATCRRVGARRFSAARATAVLRAAPCALATRRLVTHRAVARVAVRRTARALASSGAFARAARRRRLLRELRVGRTRASSRFRAPRLERVTDQPLDVLDEHETQAF